MVNLRRGEVRNEWELAARRAVAATRRNVNNATAAAAHSAATERRFVIMTQVSITSAYVQYWPFLL